jgi:hypothetical protein
MRKKKQIQHPAIEKHFKLEKAELTVMMLFLVSAGLGIWGTNILRSTLIPTKYLFAAACFGTVITFPTLLLGIKTSYSNFWIFILSSIIGSGITCTLLLFLNSVVIDQQTSVEVFDIIKRKSSADKQGCTRPYATINFYGLEKELAFSCDDEKSFKNVAGVRLEYAKGLLGFNYIVAKNLQK